MKDIYSKTAHNWSNREIEFLKKYRQRVKELETEQTTKHMLDKQLNKIAFYDILPKEQLPKYLQKTQFQTINVKEKDLTHSIKIYRKENLKPSESKVRKDLKRRGQVMLLSQIYQYLDQPSESQAKMYKTLRKQISPLPNIINELDDWEKSISKKGTLEARFSKLAYSNEGADSKSLKKQFIVKKFKIGSDYTSEIQKNLEIISYSHSNQSNLLSRYSLIQNSSKLLIKELLEMKEIVQKEIQNKIKALTQSRKQHHRLFSEKLKLQAQEQELNQEVSGLSPIQAVCFSYLTKMDKMQNVIQDKKVEMENNEAKISKIKKRIESLEEQIHKNEEQFKNIMIGEKAYLKISLRNGVDCRETGFGWIVRKLSLNQSDIPHTQFPEYLDKKSRIYLVTKSKNEQALDKLLEDKKEFVRKIGKQNPLRKSKRKSSIKLDRLPEKQHDEIKEDDQNSLQIRRQSKKYSRSAKKISALREQFQKNESLFLLRDHKKQIDLSNKLEGLSGKQIYRAIGEKIKKIDFSKLKKEKNSEKSDLIFEYQNLLEKIKELHIMTEEQDIQHENHLLNFYRGNKDVFFVQAAACFGYKKAYSLIIKNFPWKNQAVHQ